VGIGASCFACGEQRRENLRIVELLGKSHPMCHNCATRALKLMPMPKSLESIRERLNRDRRGRERRAGRRDFRIFSSERRGADRRIGRVDDITWLGDEHVVELIEEAQPANDAGELTMIFPAERESSG
jgi:hypothetical protein